MRTTGIAAPSLVFLLAAGCHTGRPPASVETAAERTVFTDSAMHARLCQPNKAGEDWRRVCTPLDQGVQPVRPVAPPPDATITPANP